MKKIIMYLGKNFCLMLGVLLLIPGTQIFSQKIPDELLFTSELSEKLGVKKITIKNGIEELQDMQKLILESKVPIRTTYHLNKYDFISKYKLSLQKLKDIYVSNYAENEINFFNYLNGESSKEVIERFAYQYTDGQPKMPTFSPVLAKEDELIFDKLEKIINNIEDINNRYEFFTAEGKTYTEILTSKQVKEWNNCTDYLLNRFNTDISGNKFAEIQDLEHTLYKKVKDFFYNGVNPEDVMEYAYKNGMLPKEKAGIKLTLEAMDGDVPLATLVKNIRLYLTEFGTKIKDVKFYPAVSLTRELKGMSLAERTEYVNELTDLQKGSKTFVEDFGKLDRPTKRYVSKSITKGFWVLAGLGAIATAVYITDVAADNHFNSGYTISNRELATIGKKIEDGTANIKEKFAFFTNPNSQRFVETDPVYTLNLVQLASDVYAADELLKDVRKAQEQEINGDVEQNILNNLNKQIGMADFGIGTL